MDSYNISIQGGKLRECMAGVNLPWPGSADPPLDGEVHRFTDPESSSRPDKNSAAWIVGHTLPDGVRVAHFGSWRREAGPWTWCEADELSAEQQAELDRLKAEAERERERRHAQARIEAIRLWDAATPVKHREHPYLTRKQVDGQAVVRMTAEAVLLVPLRDTAGDLHTLIRIWPDGTKRLLEDGDPRGHFCRIGPKPAGKIWLAEGIGTALTVAAATGQATVCCGDASNLPRVARALRAKYPDMELVIAADHDDKGAQGAAAALLAAGPPARVMTPPAQEGGGTDWNDVHVAEGLDVVQRHLLGEEAAPVATVEWPDPIPLPVDLPPVEAFPLALLPDAFRPWIADIADRLQCPPDFPAIGALVALAGLVGRRVGIRPKRQDDWTVVPNLWGLVVGRPGLLKSPALAEAMKPVHRLERLAAAAFKAAQLEADALAEVRAQQAQLNKAKVRELLKNGASPPEIVALVYAAEDKGPIRRRYVVNDSSVEKLGELLNENPTGLLVFRDELLGLLSALDRDGQEGARQFYLEAWNGTGRFCYDRIGRGTVDIAACCLSILGSIQPGPLETYLATAPDDGLMQRFQLAVWPDPPPNWTNVDRWPDKAAKEAAWQAFERLDTLAGLAIGATPGDESEVPYLRFDEAAQREFDDWRKDLEHRLRADDLHPVMETVLAKHRSLVPSLALLIHVADAPDGGPVSHAALLKACAWTEYLESHARRIYAAHRTTATTAAIALAKRLRERALPDPFGLREVYLKGWSRLDSPEKAKAAAEVLVDHHWLRARTEPPGPMGGRPKTQYTLNPKAMQS
ncbi:MAG: DUF3987 domain-containing protein [Candidatus Contendobacter sp.]|nr:DUF3987 domain-containing protein [Candidatus Contendobacter sp.]MDG4557898.1 DUF3987 domain-containing protein [Candidatus Contendobacter sp.]